MSVRLQGVCIVERTKVWIGFSSHKKAGERWSVGCPQRSAMLGADCTESFPFPLRLMLSLSSGLRAFLAHLERHGLTYDFDVAMVVGGAAFRHYFFTPEDNHAWLVEYPGEYWREDSLRVENYGLYEAVQGQTGWSARRWTKLTGAELVTLLRHEQKDGRLLRLVGNESIRGGLLETFEASRQGLRLVVVDGDHRSELVHPDLSTLDAFVASLGELQTLRKEPGDVPTSRRHALSADVLRWATQHWNSRRETLFDVQAYYATGDRAWSQLESLTASLLTEALEDRDSAAGLNYVRAHLQELAIARRSAARFFNHAGTVAEHLGPEAAQHAELDALALAWSKSADALDIATQSNDAGLIEAIKLAHAFDAAAFAALEHFII